MYHRNRRADWYGAKGMWIDRKWETFCGFEFLPLPWPWPWIFKVKFWQSCISRKGWSITQTPDIFSLADATWKHTKYPCFCILPLEFGSTLTYINMETVRFYVQTAINLHRKCLGTPDCQITENMLINFIWLNVQAKYLVQIILYHFEWDMALWKWPKCPPYMQRTWWQTVATQHTGST